VNYSNLIEISGLGGIDEVFRIDAEGPDDRGEISLADQDFNAALSPKRRKPQERRAAALGFRK
jgi:hypothetical protein